MTGIELVTSPTDEMCALVAALDAELGGLYTPNQNHGLTLEAIFQPHVRFFIARVGSETVGCGALAFFDGHAEIKRMYLKPAMRGSGVADAILQRLEREAVANGCKLLKLETGVSSPAALRFYERFGFTPCAIFPPYDAMDEHALAASVFYEKRLA